MTSLFDAIDKAEKEPIEEEILNKANENEKPLSLFDQVQEQVSKNAELVDDLILRKYKFDRYISSEKLFWFKQKVADFLQIAEARGFGVIQLDNGEYEIDEKNSKEGIHRTEKRAEQIRRLEDNSSPKKYPKLDITLPSLKEIKINNLVESPKRESSHITFDFETGKHQEPIVMGAYHHEARRYVLWKKAEFGEINTYELNNGYLIEVYCRNPLEALWIADIENVYSRVLLSAIAQNQLELVSILEEIRIKDVPFDFKILEKFLYHKLYTIYISHNAKFDVNMIHNLHNDHKKEGYQFLLPNIEPKTIKLNFGKNSYNQDGYAKKFQLEQKLERKLGNISAGFRFAIKHQTHWNWLGVPQISLYPIQESAEPSSFALDTLLLAMSIQFQKPKEAPDEIASKFGLDAISFGTPYEKKMVTKEKKVFALEDFTISPDGKLSEANEYLLYDCFSLISAYAGLTQKIPYQKLHEVLGLSLQDSFFSKPLVCQLFSTATLAKDILFKSLQKNTLLERKQIETNIETERHFLLPFEKIPKVWMEDRKRYEETISTYSGGRIEAHVYGKVKPIDGKTIEFSDFASQYPHMAHKICAYQQYIEAAKGILHKRIVQDQKAVENNVWNRLNAFIKDINSGMIHNKPFANINGTIKVDSKIKLQIRLKTDGKKKKMNDQLIMGEFITTISDLVGALYRKYRLEDWTIDQLRKKVKILSGIYLKFSHTEIKPFGEEYFTKLYALRSENKHIPTLEQMIKIIMNASYGIASEGISKEDYTGKLFIPSIANGITATARLMNSIAEIETLYRGGQPLITHTDSVVSLADPQTHIKVAKLFSQVDPLINKTKEPIEWISILGKAKYGMKFKSGKIKVLTHGSGAYGSRNVESAYKAMFKLLNDEEYTVSDAAELAKHKFPLFHQVDVKNNYKWKKGDKRKQHSGVRKIRELLEKGDLVDEFLFKNISIYFYKKITKLKINVKEEYLFITTPRLRKGMFFQNATFGNVRIANATPIDSEEICEFLLTQDIPKAAKQDLEFHLTTRIKAATHLKRRFWFDRKKYSRKVEPKYKEIVAKLIARRKETKKSVKTVIERSISTHIFRNLTESGYVCMQVMEKQRFSNVPDIPLVTDDILYPCDGYTYSGFVTLPNLNFTEYLEGNRNRGYTNALINIGRSASEKYATIKFKDKPEKLKKRIERFRHFTKMESLPFPKKGNHIYINSQVIPIPNYLEDKQILKDNTPFTMEKWILDVILTRDQLNDLIKKGTLEPIDELLMKVLKPRQLAKKYEKYQKEASLSYAHLNYKWYYILRPFNSLDANSYMHVYIIVGKNRTLNFKFHLNPTSKHLINFNTMRVNKTKLIEDSGFISEIMAMLLDYNFLACFSQNRSLTEEDILLKNDPPEVMDAISDMIALMKLRQKIKYCRVKLSELHIATDIKPKGTPKKDLTLALQIAQDIMQESFEKEAINGTNGDQQELKFRRNFQVSRARTNKGVYYQNYTTGRANIIYPKGYRQIANKFVRRALKKQVDPEILKYAKVNADEDAIRIETQIKGFASLNDHREYETHKFMVDWFLSILQFIKRNRSKIQEFDNLYREIMKANATPFNKFIKEENERSRLWQTIKPKPPD